MWKNSLKNVESGNNKILYETLLDFFLQRNGTYFLNKPCIKTEQLQHYIAQKHGLFQVYNCQYAAKNDDDDYYDLYNL